MSKVDGNRLMRKQIPFMSAFPLEGDVDWSIQYQGGGWELVANDIGTNYAVWRGYFDIEGLSQEQLSIFVGGAGWQEADEWVMGPSTSFDRARIKTWDILSKAKIDNEALDKHGPGTSATVWHAPGFAGSNYNLEEIFAGRYRHFDFSTTITAGFNQTYEQVWGTGDATAGNKIYITRIVQLTGLATYPMEAMVVPPQNVIVPVSLVDEKDLVYMERLRRSYVLAESRSP